MSEFDAEAPQAIANEGLAQGNWNIIERPMSVQLYSIREDDM